MQSRKGRKIPNHYQERGNGSGWSPIPRRLVLLIVEIDQCPLWPPLRQRWLSHTGSSVGVMAAPSARKEGTEFYRSGCKQKTSRKIQPRSLRPIAHHQRGEVIRAYCICAPVATLARVRQSHDRSLQLTKGKMRIKRQDDGREGSVKRTWLILLITARLTELALCKHRFLVVLTWCGCILRSKKTGRCGADGGG